MKKKYDLNDLMPYEVQEDVVRQNLLMYYEIAEEEEVRQACKVLLEYLKLPGEDYDGILGPD